MSKLREIIRRIIKEEKSRLKENFTLNNLEDHYYSKERRIKNNMNQYGFDEDSVGKIKNYRDLASVLGIDANLLKNVDIEEYASFLSGLLNQDGLTDDPWAK